MAWSALRWLRRALLFAPAAGCALLAIVCVGAGSRATTLACERSAGRCTWSSSSWYGGGERVFAIDSVREVRLVTGLGKYGRDAETALIFASGHELHLARDDEAVARSRSDAIDAFFAGRTASLRDHQASPHWLLLAAAALAAGAVVLSVRAARTRVLDTVAMPGAPSRSLLARREVRLLLGVVVLAVAIQAAMMIVADRTQGTLDLECRGRCRFQGAECLPGGSLRSPLDPGDYTIEVWAASGPERWLPRTFTIELGEVTRFVCE